jgi:hypothetical protein
MYAAVAATYEVTLGLPESFVVCGYDLGYQGTSLALIALWSVWICVDLFALIRMLITTSFAHLAASACVSLVSVSMLCADIVVTQSSYRRLLNTPQQPWICAAMVALFLSTCICIFFPSLPLFFCTCGVDVAILTTVATFDLLGQHAKHLKLDKLAEEYKRCVRRSVSACRRRLEPQKYRVCGKVAAKS